METGRKAAADWDMTPYFSALGAEDYVRFGAELIAQVRALQRRAAAMPPVEAGQREAWAAFLGELETASMRMRHLGSYLSCLGAADAGDEAVRAESGRLEVLASEMDTIYAVVCTRLAEAADSGFEALLAAPELAGAGHWLRRHREIGRDSMSPELEALAAELQVNGLSAWSRLYNQLTGKLTFELRVPEQPVRQVPVSRSRALLEDPDPAVRKAAFDGTSAAWAGLADTLAACFNGISGSRLTLYRRRKQHFLDAALFEAGIERRTLETMMDVVAEAQPMVRRYLQHKARLLGLERLGYQDQMAPVSAAAGERLSWDEGVRLVLDAFEAFHPELADFARHAVKQRWIDHTPRHGKRPGGFCSSSPLVGQSRIFMTYDGTSADVLTLAHELGHAFHNWTMRDLRSWARAYPMTLAETASTFCEQVVLDRLLERASNDRDGQLELLDARLQDAMVFLLNNPMRFWFECDAYRERADGELSVARLQELVLAAQQRAYGDALDSFDPCFWASKLHFYIARVSFYNFPYTFGYLFSLGIFARARKEGAEFLPRYRALLRQTGSAPAEQVARQGLGVDLGAPEFWRQSVELVAADCRAFEALAG